MDCRQFEALLDDYLKGSLDKHLEEAMENHLAGCPTCEELFLGDDEAFDELLASSWHQAEPKAGLLTRIMAEVERPLKRRFPLGMGALLLGWSYYFVFWLLTSLALARENGWQRAGVLALRLRSFYYLAISLLKTLGNSLSLLTLTPLGLGILTLSFAVLGYGFYRLNKEEGTV